MIKKIKTEKIYQFKITLKYTKPSIWRRIQVPGHFSLGDLHQVIQISMGWDNDHLFDFVISGVRYEDVKVDSDPDEKNVYETAISSAFTRKGAKAIYTYDFGDSWEHEMLVEGIIDPEASIKYPLCIDGKLSCPLEDCGGVDRYYRILEILKDPQHNEYNDMLEWIGPDIDPYDFNCEDVNKRLT